MIECDKAEFLVLAPVDEFPLFLRKILGNSSSEAMALPVLTSSREKEDKKMLLRLNCSSI